MQAYDDTYEIQPVSSSVRAPPVSEPIYPLFVVAFRRPGRTTRSFNQHWGLYLETYHEQTDEDIISEGDLFHANPGNDGTTILERRRKYDPTSSDNYLQQFRVSDVRITMPQFEMCCYAAAEDREFGILGNNCHRYVMDVLHLMVSEGFITKQSYTEFFEKHGTVFTGTLGNWINKGFLLSRPSPDQRTYLYDRKTSSKTYHSADAQQGYYIAKGGSQNSYYDTRGWSGYT
ncbi:hypothetical protein TWF694_006026 [Orbilia ellipsospora]|uniref:Uncharacterized protein n=1 Tax=Orbilia ellipsospora TaxID=2528407 RepID=A0AAV9WR39_9PEZI